MFKKTALITGITLAFTSMAQAQQQEDAIVTGNEFIDTYRWEIRGGYEGGEVDTGLRDSNNNKLDDLDVERFNISGSYYFKDVDTTKGPRAEAAFLDHASDINLFYNYGEIEDFDNDEYGIGGRAVLGAGNWIIEGRYTYDEPIGNAERDRYEIGVGKYITDRTTLVLGYRYGDIEFDDVPAGFDDNPDFDSWGIGLRHVFSFDNWGGLALEGNYGFVDIDDRDDIDIYNLTGTWYPTHDLGIGLKYGAFDGGTAESDEYSIFAEWFVTRNIAVDVAYNYAELDDTDVEENTFAIGAKIRF